MAQGQKTERQDKDEQVIEKLVAVNRVSKTVKGGRRMGFAALVVAGNGKGQIGVGHGKAKEVPEAIRKASDQAKRSFVKIPLKEGRTIYHDLKGRSGAGQVVLRMAPVGTGIIAGGPLRAIFEVLGVQDLVAKSIGSSNPYNMVYATIDALVQSVNPRVIAARRGKKVPELFGKKAKDKADSEELAHAE